VQSVEGKIGRIFLLRLDDNDVIPTCIEEFAQEKKINFGWVTIIGCLKKGNVAMGPRDGEEIPPNPMMIPIDGVHEMLAVGFIAPDASGKPVLHIHGSMGRAGQTKAGCLRDGVSVWCYSEAVINEITGIEARRLFDKETGFILLNLEQQVKGNSK